MLAAGTKRLLSPRRGDAPPKRQRRCAERLWQKAQGSRHSPEGLRQPRSGPGILRKGCGSRAAAPEFSGEVVAAATPPRKTADALGARSIAFAGWRKPFANGKRPSPTGRWLVPAGIRHRPVGHPLGAAGRSLRPGGRPVGPAGRPRRPTGRWLGSADTTVRPDGRSHGSGGRRDRPDGPEPGARGTNPDPLIRRERRSTGAPRRSDPGSSGGAAAAGRRNRACLARALRGAGRCDIHRSSPAR